MADPHVLFFPEWHPCKRRLVLAALAACATGGLQAQDGGAVLPTVTITAPARAPAAGVAGFGERPLESLPLQATLIGREQIEAAGARRLADLTKFDASVTDAYNSPGYWDFLSVRGYVLDQRFNYRREGLPITAETVIPLDNKERVEILRGISGIQAGTSAPGGLVNYVVKRPTASPLRSLTLHTGERGTLGAALDVGGRTGIDGRFGYRVNLARENRKPEIDDYDGLRRSLAAFAGDWRLNADAVVDLELEWSQQTSISLPGYSLAGDTVPATRSPFNLNNQPWSLPNRFEALTGTLRYERAFGPDWRWTAQIGSQRLKTDDRLAFPFGCFDNDGGTPADPNDDLYFPDRYCPDGRFDLYDFRSENERRRVHAAQTALQGEVRTGGLTHALQVGLLASRLRYRLGPQVFQFVGQGNIDGSVQTPANPEPNATNTNRSERSLEFFANDAIDWGGGWTTWLGARHTRLDRASVQTDGSAATAHEQSITTPWAALSYEWQPRHHVYASWGRGAESAVVPGLSTYSNAGEALPALKSRQWEIGLKGASAATDWSLAYFDIERPAVTDTGSAFFIDGSDRHRGIEGAIAHETGPWLLRVGAMLLDAERRGSSDASRNRERPINVPRHTLKAQSSYRVAALPGLALHGDVVHEGRRNVLADGSIELPSWTRTDVAASYRHRLGGTGLTWRLGIDNLFGRRAWKESPLQFGHVYLFPLEARTVRLSLQAEL